MPDPDDFDRQLRDLTSGEAEPPKFTEPSAAERIRRLPNPPPPPRKLSWRKARKARQLRRPVDEPGRKQPGSGQGRLRRGKTRVGLRGQTSANLRKRRMVAIARTVGIVVAFAALLYALHRLGLGPQ